MFDGVPKIIIILWIIAVIMSLAITGVAIWGAIELVHWVTSGGLSTLIHGS
jgi:hypothetical protein